MESTGLPPELPQSHKTLTAHCLCKSIHFTVTIPASSLPLPVHLCHCPICRYTHGTLCIFHATLPKHIVPEFVYPSSLSGSASSYVHSTALSSRFFCSTCGCHFGDCDLEPDPETGKHEWRVATSVFETHGEDTFQIRSHVFTNSALGGGLFDWLPAMGDRPLKIWNPDPDNKIWTPAPTEKDRPEQEFDAAGNERLRAECHCGGVSFTIPRPTAPGVEEDEFLRRFVSPLEKDKWMATLDLCDDCRLVDGTHAVAWSFLPLALMEPRIGPDLKMGTMEVYASSEGVRRTFCGTCGATVFFADDRNRNPSPESQIVDVAVGLFRAPEGVLADRWLTWRTGRIAWYQSGEKYDAGFARSLAKGHAEWGRQKYDHSPDFVIE